MSAPPRRVSGPPKRITNGEGWTDLFIHPPYEFKVVDCLVTNFHLPRSSLLMLVSAFAGRERILADLRYKTGLMRPECFEEIRPDGLTYTNCHGDYHVMQLVCGERSIRAVIDFSGACEQPAMWEVIRFYSYGDAMLSL